MLNKLILTEKDVIKKVAKKLNLDEIKVKRVLSSSIEYMKHLTEEDKVYTINLPYLGNMVFNTISFLRDKHLKERHKETVYNNKERKYVSYKIGEQKFNEIDQIIKKQKEEKGYLRVPKHCLRKNLNFFSRGINYIYQLEEHQNGWANGYEDYEDGLSPKPIFKKKDEKE